MLRAQLTTFEALHAEITSVRLAQHAAKVKLGDAMDVDAFDKGKAGKKGKGKGKPGGKEYTKSKKISVG